MNSACRRRAGPIFFNFWHAGLYPAIITSVKFQVDWSKGLESTAYGCLKSGALVLPMIVALTTVLRTTVINCDLPFLAANRLTALLLGGPPRASAQGPSAL